MKDEETGEKMKRLVGFRPVRAAFDYPDTDGKAVAIPQPPEWSIEQTEQNLRITRMPFTQINGNVQAYSKERAYALNPLARYPLKSTVHELAHIVLGHTVQDYEEYKEHRGLREFGAESAAFLVLNELGVLDDEQAATSRGYIQSWLRGDKPPDQAIRQAFSAAEQILQAGRMAKFAGRVVLAETAELSTPASPGHLV